MPKKKDAPSYEGERGRASKAGDTLREQDTELSEKAAENPFVPKFENFFKAICLKQIEKLAGDYPEKRSLLVDFRELEHFDYGLADELLENPDYLLEAASAAMQNIDIPMLEGEEFKPHIRFYNLPEERQPILRDISSEHLNRMISVEGVIKQITDVLPKLKIATWECKRCGASYRIPQSGQRAVQPVICECKHRDFNLAAEDSEFVDYQKIQVQEPLELLKGSEQATNLNIYVSDDLVNRIAPGDRTRITGILRLMPPQKPGRIVYGRYLEGLHLEETAKEFEKVEISKEEEAEIRKLARNPKIYDMLVRSIAPNIYGHEVVKEGIALQLFGGIKKILPGDNRIRGNIHILLVGEPGMAKSAILQAVDKIAPKSVYTAGRTATGAGISATAVKDEFGEGGWTLKAGALVLASGGICMVDELDKMEPQDRSALHESMEQESISVAKAGIVTRFKTETSVLAAANPKFSRFDPYQNYLEQVNLPASLISRFDLFFMIRDVLDRKKDEEIASHILKTHQAGEMMLQKQRGIAKRGASAKIDEMERAITPAIEGGMLKKYIAYARQNVFPLLTDDRIKEISDYYINLRDLGRKQGSYAATHRQLEALVRLSEASARIRLSDTVEKEDSDRAIKIFRACLQDLVTDHETGRIDIDIITTGTTATQLTNLKKVLRIVKEKGAELDMVPVEDIAEEAKLEGIDEEKLKETLSKLEKSGDIYRPRHGFVKATQKK